MVEGDLGAESQTLGFLSVATILGQRQFLAKSAYGSQAAWNPSLRVFSGKVSNGAVAGIETIEAPVVLNTSVPLAFALHVCCAP